MVFRIQVCIKTLPNVLNFKKQFCRLDKNSCLPNTGRSFRNRGSQPPNFAIGAPVCAYDTGQVVGGQVTLPHPT
jgi:hypothetical protein